MRYRADIDGLRAVAVVGVVLYHARLPWLPGGFAGVDVFFVISGYLIARLFMEEREGSGRVDLRKFFLRRVRRLVPLLLAVLLVCVPLAHAVLLPGQLKDFGQSLVSGVLFAANLLFWRESGYFAATAAEKPLLHLWSLGVEAQFYLLAPLLLWRRGLALVAAVASLAGAVWAVRAHPDAAFFLTPLRLWEFLAGAGLVLCRVRQLPGQAGWLGLGLILLAFLRFDGGMAWPGVTAMVPVAGAALIIAARPLRVLSLPSAARLGQLSYGLYLWHYPVFVLFALRWPEVAPEHAAPGLILLSVGLAWASWHLIEQPGRATRVVRLMPVAAFVLLAAGLAHHLTEGLPNRLPVEARQILALTQMSTTRCHDRLAAIQIERSARCTIGADGVAPDIVLIGDSHADHLGPALDRALAERGRAAVVYTASWCVPVPGFGTEAPGRGPECAALMQAAWDRVLADPTIATVIAAAQWGNVTHGARGGLAPVTYGSPEMMAATPSANAEALGAAFDGFAQRLSEAGRRVLLPAPVPEFARPVPQHLARRAWAGTPAEELPSLDDAARNGEANRLLARFAARAGARLVPVRDLFCPQGGQRCRVRAPGGAPLWRDASHLSPAGAALVVARLMELVDAAPDQPGGHHDHLSLRQPSHDAGPGEHVHR